MNFRKWGKLGRKSVGQDLEGVALGSLDKMVVQIDSTQES